MKQIIHLILLFITCTFLWGCPYDSPYGIDAIVQQNIDESLLGYWAGVVQKPGRDEHKIEEPIKVIFSQNTPQEYTITIYGRFNELKPYHLFTGDSITGTAYLSKVSGRQFLNVFIKGKMYIAEVKKDVNFLSLFCLAEHFTAKYIKSSTELRKAIEFYYRVSATPAYDEYFIIKNLQKTN